ncbi:hypothetical protein [Paracidovorax avenae]|uniref:hypothetical protein n=1 Tax=Paracidovorax avenae TaxID=80867 RepID=UPI001F438A10|nr:hypothetical protein [Paracidovorax avenae]
MRQRHAVHLLLALIAVSQAALSAASPAGTAPGAATTAQTPLQLIDILSSYAHGTQGSDADCSDMQIDAARVRYFWNHAIEGTEEEYRRGIDLADCEASAEVHFRQGGKGTLSLDAATGWGALEQRGTTRYFYCDVCEGILGRNFRPDAPR